MEQDGLTPETAMDPIIEISEPRSIAITWSPTYTKIFGAVIKAQSEMGAAVKEVTNPFYKMKYADLSENISVCKKPLNDNGIGILQPLSSIPHGVRVTTLLIHTSGEWMASELDFPAEKDDPQAYGKVATYARRYSLNAILSIPSEDDDAQEATEKMAARSSSKPPPSRHQPTPGPARPSGPCAPKTSFFKEWAGKPLADIPMKQLEWFSEKIFENTQDKTKSQYKAQNEATLKLIIAELDARNKLNKELDEQAAAEQEVPA